MTALISAPGPDGATGSGAVRQPWQPSNPNHKNGRKTHCARGHEFTEANTFVRPGGRRMCRACDREDHYARYWAERGPEPEPGPEARRDEWVDAFMADRHLKPRVRLLLHTLASLADPGATTCPASVPSVAALMGVKPAATYGALRDARHAGWVYVERRHGVPIRYLFTLPPDHEAGTGPTAA